MEKQMIDGFPRRSRLDLHTPAEAAIRAAIVAVEAAGAHPLLTDAVNLLIKAGDTVADFVELDPGRPVKPHRSGGGHWVGKLP